jgi:hypothetical protein
MSSFHIAPGQGHLDCLKRMYGYLKRNPTGATRFRVKISNHVQIASPIQYDWSSSINGNVTEEIPPDIPTPQGKSMPTSTYQDANLHHCHWQGYVCHHPSCQSDADCILL